MNDLLQERRQGDPVINTHPRSAVQTVERDENDEIVRTVTQYKP